MSEGRAMIAGALVGALVGSVAGYLFFTDNGRRFRERMEPAVDDLRREFARFQRTLEKVGQMAGEGMRVVQQFNAARHEAQFSGEGRSH